jgi:hypothetical protein
MSIACTIVGVPATVVFFFISDGEFNLPAIPRSIVRWRRNRCVLIPDLPLQPVVGYELLAEQDASNHRAEHAQVASLPDLWC